MEISSMTGTNGLQGFQMSGMRYPPEGKPEDHAKEIAGKIFEQQDADGDDLLSANELTIASDKFTKLDEDGDGLVSSDELSAGILANMEAIRTLEESGSLDSTAANKDVELMRQLQSLTGESPATRTKATETYSQMQEFMFGGDSSAASCNLDQDLLSQLNVTV